MGLYFHYKEFINTYGTGAVANFLWVLNPFTENKYLHLLNKGKIMADAYITSKQRFPEDFRHKVYPEPGGLLAWGATDNGDELYWLAEGEPDGWPVIVYPPRASEYLEYAMPVTEFIYRITSREMICEAFPDDFSGEKPEFISAEAD